ncbi:MAG: nucleotidyltransferase family protein [Pseudomonadota bacterium]
MPTVALVVLAAGFSRRFGTDNKLLADFDGCCVLERTLRGFVDERFLKRIAVTKPGDLEVEALARSLGFETVSNKKAALGMGSSIATGIDRCGEADGAMIGLADMPYVDGATVSEIISTFLGLQAQRIVAPTYRGQRGHPIVFPAEDFPYLLNLRGDEGAKALLHARASSVCLLGVDTDSVLKDVDSPADIPSSS